MTERQTWLRWNPGNDMTIAHDLREPEQVSSLPHAASVILVNSVNQELTKCFVI
jgi:hypothetical protein